MLLVSCEDVVDTYTGFGNDIEEAVINGPKNTSGRPEIDIIWVKREPDKKTISVAIPRKGYYGVPYCEFYQGNGKRLYWDTLWFAELQDTSESHYLLTINDVDAGAIADVRCWDVAV